MVTFIIVLLGVLIVYVALRISRTVFDIEHYWQHYYNDFTYSTQTFYKDVEVAINTMQMPGVSTTRVKRHEKSLLSASREYLQVGRQKLVFEVCAAPFGTGFFISSRRGTLPGLRHKLVLTIPVVGGYLARAFFHKTYYQVDSQNMFASAVHHTVLEIANKIGKEKGMRILTDAETLMAPAEA